MKTKTFIQNLHYFQKQLFWSMTGLLLCFAALYGYFIVHSVSQVLLRADIEREISRMESSVSDLELEYVAKKEQLTREAAFALGFGEPTAKLFVAKRALTGRALTLRNEI